MSFMNVGDIIELGEFAFQLLECGFSKCKNAG